MRKLVLSFSVVCACLLISYAQPTLQWSQTYSGPSDVTSGKHIGLDASGNIYSGGTYWNGSSFDYVAVKYDNSGVQQWIRIYDSGSSDELQKFCVDAAGNVYLSGYGPAGGNNNFRTVKYNTAGVQQWVAVYNNTANRQDYVASMDVDGSGNVYVTGYCDQGGGFYDIATVKYNSAGAQQWASSYRFANNTYNIAQNVVSDGSGNVYVIGYYQTGSGYDMITLKYNSGGTQQWVTIYGAVGLNDTPIDLKVDGSGNTYVVGRSYNGLNYDAVTIKYNSLGAQQWASVFSTAANDNPSAAALDASGNVYFTGYTTGAGPFRTLTLKYNNSGAQQWVRTYGNASNVEDVATEIAIDGSGNVVVVGYTYLNATSSSDVLLMQYDNAGNQSWVSGYAGSPGFGDNGRSVVLDAFGGIYVNGNVYNGADFDMVVLKFATTKWYVDNTATGANNGTSWTNAFTSFQSAVASADAGDTVLVAAGTHKPSVGPARLKKYTLVNGVCYYGGFPNGGGTFASRDFNVNRTILSGDIGTLNDSTDNCFVVVDASNLNSATVLSGFTVERGNADSSNTSVMYGRSGAIHYDNNGAMRLDSVTCRNNFGRVGGAISMFTTGGNLVLTGCIIQNNNCQNSGGGIYTGGPGTFTNCTFTGNKGVNGAGVGVNSLPTIFTFTGCTFTNNICPSGAGGGGVYLGNGNTTTITNCVFTGNNGSTGSGGAIGKFAGALSITNSTFTQNTAGAGGAIYSSSGGYNLDKCVFRQNVATSQQGGACYNNGSSGTWINCTFWKNSAPANTGGAVYNNTGGTLTLMNCSFNENFCGSSQGGGFVDNSTSNANITNCIFWGNKNSMSSDAAANSEILHFSGTLVVSNTIWQGNPPAGTVYNVDPLFTNTVTGDLSLTMCSPAIDTATSVGAPATDVILNARPFIAKLGGLNYDLGAYEFMALVLLPEVNVTGNGNTIADGDVTPSLTDHTDFGSQSVCNGTVVRTFTIENSGNGNLTVATPTISGPNAVDFTVTALPSTTVGFPGNTTFQVTFNPSGTGFRNATITFTNDDCDEPVYDFAIRGSGVVITVNPASQTNVLCFGNTTGAASVNATGGMGTLTYDWTPGTPAGDGTNSITGLTAQSYTCTVTDINGCTATATINITSPPLLVLTPMYSINVTCFGVNNGVASVQGSGGVTPYFVDWTPGNPTGDGGYTVTDLAPGTYTCTLTDGNGCTASPTSFTITQPSPVVITSVAQTNINCAGLVNGAASVVASGGTGSLSYSWTPGTPTGDGTNSVTGLFAGVWNCSVYDQNGCSAFATFTITQPPLFYGGMFPPTNVSCNGGSNGAATVEVYGGVTPYTYNWAPGNPPGDGTATATGLTGGSWTCTVTDANGCTFNSTVNVTQPTPITITSTQTNNLCFGGSNGAASVFVSGGTTAYSYNWTPGNPTGDGTASVTGLAAGTWTCTVTDANSCVTTQTFNITQPISLSTTGTSTNISCFAATNGSITVTPVGGTLPYTYAWSPSGGSSATASGLGVGTYTCVITDANGCTTSYSVAITQPTVLAAIDSITDITCFGQSNGAATVFPTGGTGPYTYAWSPSGGNAATASGLSGGMFFCTITDANGCIITQTININEPSVLSATTMQTNVSCNGGTNGDAMVMVSGGTGPYTYAWLPSGGNSAMAMNLSSGTYSCTITDANGCTNTQTFNITQPGSLTASATATAISCNGGNATVTVTGTGGTSPYTGTGTFTVTAGTYSYTVTDANGCTNTTSITITEPSAVTAAATATAILCNGDSATVTVVGAGGTSPYTGEGSFTVTAGTYSYSVTDANGCTNTTSITITEPTAISTAVVSVNVGCNGDSTGSIDLTVSGGTAPYTFDWNSGTYTTEDLTGLGAGTYVGVLTDANGCTDGGTIVISEPAVLVATVTTTVDPDSCGATNGSIDITVSGGTTGYTFVWSTAATTEDLSGVGAGAYSCVVTDTNGCTANVSGNLNDPNAPTVTLTLTVDTLCSTDAVFTLTGELPAGGTFSGPGVSGGTFDPAIAGLGMHMISYTFTDINGCTGNTTDSIFVDVCTDILFPVSGSQFTVFPNPNDGTFTLQVASVSDVTIYDAQGKLVLSQKVQPNVATPMNLESSGMYIVTVIDANGARTSQRVMVTK